MPFYLLTFRPQPSEFDLLDTFFTIMKPQLIDNKNIMNYLIVIEEDNSINRHCHILVEFKKTKSNDNQLKAFLRNKPFKAFEQMLRNKLTNPLWCHDDRKLLDTREDFLHVLGYCLKDIDACRRYYTYSEEDCVEAIEYYYQYKKIDKSQPEKNNLKIMTSKNLHVNIYDFCRKNNMRPKEQQMVTMNMKKQGYMFSQVNIKDTFQELDIHMNNDDYSDTNFPAPEDLSNLMEQLYVLKDQLRRNDQTFKKIDNLCNSATGYDTKGLQIHKLIEQRVFYEFSDDEE